MWCGSLWSVEGCVGYLEPARGSHGLDLLEVQSTAGPQCPQEIEARKLDGTKLFGSYCMDSLGDR